MAVHRDRSQTGCSKNHYWMPVDSSDVNKSGLVPQLSDTTPQRKIHSSSYSILGNINVILTVDFISSYVETYFSINYKKISSETYFGKSLCEENL